MLQVHIAKRKEIRRSSCSLFVPEDPKPECDYRTRGQRASGDQPHTLWELLSLAEL